MVSRVDDVVKGGENINGEIAWNSLFLKIAKLFLIMDVGIDQWIVTISLWIYMRCNNIWYFILLWNGMLVFLSQSLLITDEILQAISFIKIGKKKWHLVTERLPPLFSVSLKELSTPFYIICQRKTPALELGHTTFPFVFVWMPSQIIASWNEWKIIKNVLRSYQKQAGAKRTFSSKFFVQKVFMRSWSNDI